ncbi:MAG TPA: sigma-70 family RNA polymerase sigma factor [Ktedonobacterales bacterium]|nr:sigma-70 family RNA polymerase sigma factor [Ktedonobacterales bacterium]
MATLPVRSPNLWPHLRHDWFQRILTFARVTHLTSSALAWEPSQAAQSEADFEAFVHQHERPILNYLWRMVGDEQSAYDLTQETFLRAWQHFTDVRQYAHPKAWLFRVATNLALSHRQRRSAPVGAAKPLDDEDELSSSDPTVRYAERDLVRQTLQAIPAKRRAALVLREIYGLSIEEIGHTLGMSPDAVKMALYRARAQFREIYTQEVGR